MTRGDDDGGDGTTGERPGDLVITDVLVVGRDADGAVDLVIRDGRIAGIGPGIGRHPHRAVTDGGAGQAPATGGRPEHDRATVDADPEGPGVRSIDGRGLRAAPGFVDLQCNGAAGVDLAVEPERLWDVAAALPRWGVTAWLPTIVTSPPEVTRRALAALAAGPPPGAPLLAAPLGLHLEGPFLSPDRAGAHPRTLLRAPDPALTAGWSRAAGVAAVTLAPELPGALDLVEPLVADGVVVALGHSCATHAEAGRAVDRGASMVTHLFNAMDPLHHRAPGLVGRALTDERLAVGLVVDGVHVDPVVVDLAWRALGPRLVLVTDAVGALGTEPGPRRIGTGIDVEASDGEVRLPDGTLAGSVLSLDAAVRNLDAFTGCGQASAIRAATEAPAAVLGIDDRGVLRAGAVGDVVLLDGDGHVQVTVVAGRIAHRRATEG